MPWLFVGRGQKIMPFDHNAPAYIDFWKTTLDKTRRLLSQPQNAHSLLDDLMPSANTVVAIGGLPNFELYREFMRDIHDDATPLQTAVVLAFAFAVPFKDVANDSSIMIVASSVVRAQQRQSEWTAPGGDFTNNYSQALELRLAYLNNLLEIVRARIAESKTSKKTRLELMLTLWRDGHVRLTLALDELNHVPQDESTWDVLLRHCAPNVNMFLHFGEMPCVVEELHMTPFLREPSSVQSTQNKIRAANPICLAFTKVCPRRCGMRDLVEIMLEYGVRNASMFYFLMLVMAASYLGIYKFCQRRPDWNLVRDVYRLFFFELPETLRPLRRQKWSEEQRLADRYMINESDVYVSDDRPNSRVCFSDYETAVLQHYEATVVKSGKASADNTKQKQKPKRTRAADNTTNSRSTSRQRAEAVVGTIATTQQVGAIATHETIVIEDDDDKFKTALSLSNATCRLEFDRQCGRDYYDQRLAAGRLPMVNGEPQEFVAADVSVTDVYAMRRIAECDKVMPSKVQLTRRSIVYRFLSTLITSDDNARSSEQRVQAPSKKYPFTSALTQHIREFMFALLETERPLLDELSVRVHWLPWQQSVIANSDLLRSRLSTASQTGMPFIRMHRVHAAAANDTNAPTNNLYKTDNEPFAGPLLKAMTAYLQSPLCMTAPVDYVVPREYEIMMRELLNFWQYKRSYDGTKLVNTYDELQSTTVTNNDDDNIETTTVPFIETILPPMTPFGIALTKAVPNDNDTEETIREKFVDRLLFPGTLFNMTTLTVDMYNRAYRSYAFDEDVEKLLTNFAKNLASTSMFQFMLVYTFARAVETYMSVYVVPLPAHIVQQQMRVMCARYRCIDPVKIPRHAGYSLVCLPCKRYAGFVSTAKRQNVRHAEGTVDVRTLPITDDLIILDRVKRRNGILMPDELVGAKSMYEVYDHRAIYANSPYDKFVLDPIDKQDEAFRIARGDYAAYEPREPWNQLTEAEDMGITRRLFATAMDFMGNLPETLPDPRTSNSIYCIDTNGRVVSPDQVVGTPMPPIQPVATDGTVESELLFNRQVRNLCDKLMGGNHFLYGHRIPSVDNRPFLGNADSRENTRHEMKKRKTNKTAKTRIDSNPNVAEQRKDLERWNKRVCRDAKTLCDRVHCSNELMFQFSRIGFALVINQRGRAQRALDIIVMCCSCGTSVQFSCVSIRGDYYICPVCIADNSWVQWFGAGDQSIVTLATVDLFELSNVDDHVSPTTRLMSPGRSWLPDTCVRQNDKCAHPNCRKQKQADTQMIYKEVVFDSPGKEGVGYVAICMHHARMFSWLLTLPFMITRSMLGVLMHDSKTQVSIEEVQSTDYLSIYMTHLADISSSRTGKPTTVVKKRSRGIFEIDNTAVIDK